MNAYLFQNSEFENLKNHDINDNENEEGESPLKK